MRARRGVGGKTDVRRRKNSSGRALSEVQLTEALEVGTMVASGDARHSPLPYR
jgi:hypothetical protein